MAGRLRFLNRFMSQRVAHALLFRYLIE